MSSYKKYNFDTRRFNNEIALRTPDSTITFIDNFKKLAYEKIKEQLNIYDKWSCKCNMGGLLIWL